MSIKVEQISKIYNSEVKAVDNVSFTLQKGEIVGFLGPNGAGKSTVMKILINYIKDFSGEVFINGLSIRQNPIETQKMIGYLPESTPLYFEMYVREYLTFNANVYHVDSKQIQIVIDQVGLNNHAHKKIKELSKGYKQRVGLASALLHNPDVLILDEPTTGLDPNQLSEIRELIKTVGQEKTVIFSTHIMQEVEAVCDRVIVLNQGKIVVDEFINNLQKNTKQLIEVEFDIRIEPQFFKALSNLTYFDNVFDNTWLFEFDAEEDCRAKIFDFAHEQGLKILNLNKKNKGLETLFKELTN